MDSGALIGILIGCAFCAVLYILVVRDTKKAKKKIDRIVEQLPRENVEKAKLAGFHDYSENANFLVGSSVIYEIANPSGQVELKIVFYDNSNNTYRLDSVRISREIQSQRDFQVGQIVETLHNKRQQVWLKVKSIL